MAFSNLIINFVFVIISFCLIICTCVLCTCVHILCILFCISNIVKNFLIKLNSLGGKRTEIAAIAIGKACGFRPDNYLYTRNKRCLLVGNLIWEPPTHPKRLLVNINIGKTNKTRKIVQYVINCTCPNKWLCVVHLVRPLVRHRLQRVHEPLLLKPNGKIFDAGAMRAVLKLLCDRFQLNSKFYTNYCIRIGAACEDWWATGDLWLVMQRYDWDSASSCRRYLRASNPDLHKFIPPGAPLPGRPLPPRI